MVRARARVRACVRASGMLVRRTCACRYKQNMWVGKCVCMYVYMPQVFVVYAGYLSETEHPLPQQQPAKQQKLATKSKKSYGARSKPARSRSFLLLEHVCMCNCTHTTTCLVQDQLEATIRRLHRRRLSSTFAGPSSTINDAFRRRLSSTRGRRVSTRGRRVSTTISSTKIVGVYMKSSGRGFSYRTSTISDDFLINCRLQQTPSNRRRRNVGDGSSTFF